MDLIQQITMILVVFGLLGGLLWLMKRRGSLRLTPRRSDARLEVLERVSLTPQHALHLVRISGNVGTSVGILYFVNTLGSAVACLMSARFIMEKKPQRKAYTTTKVCSSLP